MPYTVLGRLSSIVCWNRFFKTLQAYTLLPSAVVCTSCLSLQSKLNSCNQSEFTISQFPQAEFSEKGLNSAFLKTKMKASPCWAPPAALSPLLGSRDGWRASVPGTFRLWSLFYCWLAAEDTASSWRTLRVPWHTVPSTFKRKLPWHQILLMLLVSLGSRKGLGLLVCSPD